MFLSFTVGSYQFAWFFTVIIYWALGGCESLIVTLQWVFKRSPTNYWGEDCYC